MPRACSSIGRASSLYLEGFGGSSPPGPTLRFTQCKLLMPNYRPKRTSIRDIIALHKMAPAKKIKALEKKRREAEAELKERYKYFHGVRHENASSEIKYSQIKVLEGYISTLKEEIKLLSKK